VVEFNWVRTFLSMVLSTDIFGSSAFVSSRVPVTTIGTLFVDGWEIDEAAGEGVSKTSMSK